MTATIDTVLARKEEAMKKIQEQVTIPQFPIE
jgi:hypothetical protein